MSNNPYEESKFAKFSRSRAFYFVLAACLIGAGAAAAFFLSEGDPVVEEKPKPPQLQVRENFTPEIPKLEDIYSQKEIVKEKEPEKLPAKEENAKPDPEAEEASMTFTKGLMPCQGDITSPFSNGELVKDETMGDWRTHNGIDISSSAGSPVRAFQSGKIKTVRNDSLWGTVVEIQHAGAVVTRYCGLDENVSFNEGDSVKAGDVIGKLDVIPAESAKGIHLHFEITDRGKYKDPAQFIR